MAEVRIRTENHHQAEAKLSSWDAQGLGAAAIAMTCGCWKKVNRVNPYGKLWQVMASYGKWWRVQIAAKLQKVTEAWQDIYFGPEDT